MNTSKAFVRLAPWVFTIALFVLWSASGCIITDWAFNRHEPRQPSAPAQPANASQGMAVVATRPVDPPNDAEIAAILLAANNTDISYAKLVPNRSQNPGVRDFATRMLTDHNAVNTAVNNLLDAIRLDPEESKTSLDFRDESTTKRDLMRELDGASFDSTYMANEVSYHTKLLLSLDRILIPSARNSQLKQVLMQVRPAVAAHLDHAVRVQAALR